MYYVCKVNVFGVSVYVLYVGVCELVTTQAL